MFLCSTFRLSFFIFFFQWKLFEMTNIRTTVEKLLFSFIINNNELKKKIKNYNYFKERNSLTKYSSMFIYLCMYIYMYM